MLVHMHYLQNDSLVWILKGIGKNLRYVDFTKVHVKLDESICKSLPGFYTIAGYYYNPAFFRKRKFRHYKILRKQKNTIKLSLNTVAVNYLKIMMNNKTLLILYTSLYVGYTMLVRQLMLMQLGFNCLSIRPQVIMKCLTVKKF